MTAYRLVVDTNHPRPKVRLGTGRRIVLPPWATEGLDLEEGDEFEVSALRMRRGQQITVDYEGMKYRRVLVLETVEKEE